MTLADLRRLSGALSAIELRIASVGDARLRDDAGAVLELLQWRVGQAMSRRESAARSKAKAKIGREWVYDPASGRWVVS